MKHNVVSIDLAKNVFQLCALNDHNKIVVNKKVMRKNLMKELHHIEHTTVVMEACYSANYWGRTIEAIGHEVKLIPPFQVKPFLVGNKNDHNDAIAIAEASMRPKARFVRVKSLEQQDLQSLQRIRARLVKHHSALINQMRGLLSEYGIVVEKTPAKLIQAVPFILEDADNGLTVVARNFVDLLNQEARELRERKTQVERERDQLASKNPDYQRLLTIRGVGPATAAEVLSSVGDGKQFRNGRHLAAWIGLTPRQHASGETSFMSGISKRGNPELRRLLIHGARSLMNWCERRNDKLSLWIRSLLTRMHPCKAIVAVANKLARIVWTVLTKQVEYAYGN